MTHMFWGEVVSVSNDAGPFKLARVRADGHEFTAQVLEPGGFHQSPTVGSQVLVGLPDGSMGKAVIIGGQAPKDRVDGQTEGMVTIKNHKNGQTLQMDAAGNVTITGGKLIVNADVEINGNMTQNGNFSQSGVHTDNNGPHTA